MRTANLAIVFTDIKGFTARTSQQTYEQNQRMLRIHAALLSPVFKAFGGRQIKTIGDAFLVVFESPTRAVLCGVAIQDRLWDYNRRVGEPEQIHVRVAVNMGEVRVEKGDVFGEPVNIAARVEGLADAGEVLFTEAVYLAMNKAEVPSEERGEYELKGIPEKVRVYRVPRGGYRLTATPQEAPAGHEGPPYGGIALGRLANLPEPEPEELLSGHAGAAAGLALVSARQAARTLGERARTACARLGAVTRAGLARLAAALKAMPAATRALVLGGPALVVLLVVGIVLFSGDSIERSIEEGRIEEARAAVFALEPGGRRTYLEGRLHEAAGHWEAAARRYADASRAGYGRGFDRLVELTEHEQCRARTAAATGLGRLGDRRALPALESLKSSDFADESGEGVLDKIFGCQSRKIAGQAIWALEQKD